MKFQTIIALLALAVLPAFSAVPSAGILPESSRIDVEAGLTCLVTLSIPEISLTDGKPEEFYDAFFYRHKQFVFGRRGSQLYFNFHDGSRWTAFILSDADFALEANRTYQLAFTLDVHQVPSQGELWTDAVIYADGRAVGRARVMDRKPAASKLPIQFARAQGFGTGWDCHGKFYDVRIINRALDADEIAELASKEKRIKFIPEGAAALPEKIRKSIDAFRERSTGPFAHAVTAALETWAKFCGEREFFKTFTSLEKISMPKSFPFVPNGRRSAAIGQYCSSPVPTIAFWRGMI
ncbi:MAG: LamG domain-containing protein [Lentisphaeria bacterium]|nr:LamG domain-containing protein [Lentisphaeria bacterium]MBQ7207563.1 LamG domain-containing protein [Lentisphaeria bacterium]